MQIEQQTALHSYAQLMIEHLPVGAALFEAHNLHLLAANSKYLSYLLPQWQQRYAVGQHLSEVLPSSVQAEVLETFPQVIQTGIASQTQQYISSKEKSEKIIRSWSLEPISENGHIHYVLLTITEVRAEISKLQSAEDAQTTLSQQEGDQERQHLQEVEALLSSVLYTSSPKELAEQLLSAIAIHFSPQSLALYSTSIEQETLFLLASYRHKDLLEKQLPPFPPLITSHGRSCVAREAVKHRDPLIQSLSRAPTKSLFREEVLGLALTDVQEVTYIPLWTDRCEGLLLAAFSREDEARDLLMATLSTCAPYLAEALAAKRLNLALSDERHRLRTVLDQLPEGVVLVEARTGKVSYANPTAASLLGFSLPHLVGAPLNQSALLSPYGQSHRHQQAAFRWNFALIDALWGKTVTNQEIAIKRPDGSEITVLSSAAPIKTSQGVITEAVMVFQDISALKRLEQQKNEFFAVANHELRTPLTSIVGFAEILHLCTPDDADALYQYAIRSITTECDHLLRLTNDLLDVSRLEYGQIDLKKSYQDLLAPLKQTIAKLAQASSTHRLHFLIEGQEITESLMGWFDLMRIEQILNNLVSNAIKYSPIGSEIEVGVRSPDNTEEVLIWVKDQGVGISASDLPHIFERFYRSGTFDSSISGFGIGLYVSRQLVQGHGGRIWADSTSGQGSTFFVVLPLSGANSENNPGEGSERGIS